MGGQVARMGEMINVYKLLIGRLERKTLIRKHRRRWEDINRMDLKYVERMWIGLNWLRIGMSEGLLCAR
jgi:hypothetical protein